MTTMSGFLPIGRPSFNRAITPSPPPQGISRAITSTCGSSATSSARHSRPLPAAATRKPLSQKNRRSSFRRRTSASAISSIASMAGLAALLPSSANSFVRRPSDTSTVSLRSQFPPNHAPHEELHRAAPSSVCRVGRHTLHFCIVCRRYNPGKQRFLPSRIHHPFSGGLGNPAGLPGGSLGSLLLRARHPPETGREMVGYARSQTIGNAYRCSGPVRATHHFALFPCFTHPTSSHDRLPIPLFPRPQAAILSKGPGVSYNIGGFCDLFADALQGALMHTSGRGPRFNMEGINMAAMSKGRLPPAADLRQAAEERLRQQEGHAG